MRVGRLGLIDVPENMFFGQQVLVFKHTLAGILFLTGLRFLAGFFLKNRIAIHQGFEAGSKIEQDRHALLVRQIRYPLGPLLGLVLVVVLTMIAILLAGALAYRQLAEITGSTPKWNFHKYLINRDGTQVVAYTSFTKPEDKDLLKKIDEFLK